MSECKKAALKCKSASGIARFQECKVFDKWFNQLLPLVKSRESCQPEQALEPCSVQPFEQGADEQEDEVDDPKTEKVRSTHSTQSSTSSSSSLVFSIKKRPFVPINGKSSSKKQKLEDLIKMTSDTITGIKEQLQRDTMGPTISFFEKENEKAREHEMQLISLMFNGQAQQPFQGQILHQQQQSQFSQNNIQSIQHPFCFPQRSILRAFIMQDNLFTNNHNGMQSQSYKDDDFHQL